MELPDIKFKYKNQSKSNRYRNNYKKTNGDDISLDDCAMFNTPASDEIEKSNLLNCSYVLEISSQGVSDELTSERDFKTFKGFPVNVELNQKNSNKISEWFTL